MTDRNKKLELKCNLVYIKEDPRYRKENEITVSKDVAEFHIQEMINAGIRDFKTSPVYWGNLPMDNPPLTKIKFRATDAQFETYTQSLRN